MNRIATDAVMVESIETWRRLIALQDQYASQPMFTRPYDKARETPLWLSTANGDPVCR